MIHYTKRKDPTPVPEELTGIPKVHKLHWLLSRVLLNYSPFADLLRQRDLISTL